MAVRQKGGPSMAFTWQDKDGQLYNACKVCMHAGKLVHFAQVDGQRAIKEIACPNCNGFGFRTGAVRTSHGWRGADPAIEREEGAMYESLIARDRCPVCLGYGQRMVLEDDPFGQQAITGFPSCSSCGGSGRLDRSPDR